MDADTRITALTTKHEYLEHAIGFEYKRPLPDSLRVTEMKREKLRIRDEIVLLEHH